MKNRIPLLAFAVIGMALPACGADETGHFYALFYDGSNVSATASPKENVWRSGEAMLAGRRLFGTQNPARLIQDTMLQAVLKGPRVVMANGDVLPGKITGFLPPSQGRDTSPCLVVSTDGTLFAADPRGLVVRADQVLRITSAAEGASLVKPGQLLLANGNRLDVRAMRWTEQGLKVLTEGGLTAVPFDAIGDFSLPKADVLQAVLADSFYPPLGPDVVIGRLATVAGAVLTHPCEMTLLGVSKASPSAQYLVVQPNWSLGLIFVPIDSIVRQSYRAAKEVPLSLLPAQVLSERVGIHRCPWRRNENVEGGELASGTIAVDLGVGTHSCCEIAFELPPQAQEFTSLVGLDRRIGPEACATCKVYLDQAVGKPLFSSGLLRSGLEPTPLGPLRVAHHRRLVLATEWAGEDRPQGAYPLDIGGHADWLMPFVTVEADDAVYCQSLRSFLPGGASWDLAPTDARRVRVRPHWDATHECWLPLIDSASAQPLTIRRTLSPLTSANDTLELIFAHFKNAPLPVIELHVDGALVAPATGRHEHGQGGKPELSPESSAIGKGLVFNGLAPGIAGRVSLAESAQQYRMHRMRWDLQKYAGQPVQLTLSISLDNQLKGLVWRELALRSAIDNSQPHGDH